MHPRHYSSEGFVLSRVKYGEADRIITIFSRKYGKISMIAKGVRKLASRKRGALENFSSIKFSAASGKNLDILTEVEIINSYENIRNNLKKVALAYYFSEVIVKITREDEVNETLFDLLAKYLEILGKDVQLKKLRKAFVYECLVTLGYWPKGKVLADADFVLEEVIERQLSSVRVGKKLLL